MATTSPLAAALKPTFAVDDESEAKYQSALKQLSDALEKRRNLPGDAVNAGYLAGLNDPAARGMGFFAEFASGLKGAREAQMQEAKEEQDVASLRLQMAQAEREMARRQKGFQFLTGQDQALPVRGAAPEAAPARTSGAPAAAAAPAGGAAPAASTAGARAAPATPVVTAGNQSGLGVMIGGREVTPALIAQLSYVDPELSKALEQQYKLTMESIAVQPGGYVLKTTREYVPFGGKPPVERFIPGNPATGQKAMTLQLPEEDAMALDKARRSGDAEAYYRIIDMYTKPLTRPGASAGTTSAAGQTPGAVSPVSPGTAGTPARPAGSGSFAQTPSEAKAASEIETEAAKEEAKIAAQGRAKRFENIITSAEDVGSRLALYKTVDSIVAKPNSEKIFGIFNRPDFLAGVGKLLETGVGLPGYSIGIPEIQNVMRNIGLPQDQINDYQLAASLFAQMQLQFSRLQQGQGSVSDFERRLFGTGSVTGEDNPGTIRKKVAMLTARAEFERSVAKELRASKLSADEFKDSDQYKNLLDSYHDRLVNIVSTPGAKPAGAKPAGARPATPAAGAASAASGPETNESLKARLRQRTP